MSDAERREPSGRLAIRSEGRDVVAYYAMPDTMTDAIRLGSIARGLIDDNAKLFDAWMALMRDALTAKFSAMGAGAPSWGGPERAPEHERSGRA